VGFVEIFAGSYGLREPEREGVLVRLREIDRDDAHRESGDVAYEHLARAVDDDAPVRGHREPEQSVLLREAAVVRALHDLQIPQPDGEHAEEERDDRSDRDEAVRAHEGAGPLPVRHVRRMPVSPCAGTAIARSDR